MTDWLELTFSTGTWSEETLEEALLAVGALAVTLTDAKDTPVLEPLPGEMPLWPETLVTGLFAAPHDLDVITLALKEILQTEILPFSQTQTIKDRDWVRAWMDHYKPMKFGETLWICPKHLPPPDPKATTIMLDPGLAFGTGTHPTTALCLQWLDRHQDFFNNQIVIDYGCGSGILGIAARKLAASKVYAVDIDPQAIIATKDNAQNNAIDIEVSLPAQFNPPSAKVVLANILAGPLVALAPMLSALVDKGGALILSGLLERDAEEVKAAYRTQFTFESDEVLDGWVRLFGVKQ